MKGETPTCQSPVWLFPTLTALVFGVIFWGALLIGPRMMNADGDLGRHLTVGRYILATRRIPTTDLFSHTMPGERLIPHEWIAQLAFALAERAFGLNGVVWLTAALLSTTYALLMSGAKRLGLLAPLALVSSLGAALVGSVHWLTRPHIFTLLFFVVFLLALERYRQGNQLRAVLPLPLLMILWANTHGAFISGIVLVLLYAVGAALDRQAKQCRIFLALGAALILAAWINPVGPRLMLHSFDYLGQKFLVDLTQEYRSPDFHTVGFWAFAALLLGSLALGWLLRRRLDWTSLLLLGVWSAFGLYSARNIPLYALVAVLIMGREGQAWLRDAAPHVTQSLTALHAIDRQAWGWMWVGVAVALGIGLQSLGIPIDATQMGNTFNPALFPVAAVDTLHSAMPEGAVFNEFAWGGYLLYRQWPALTVFIDGQTDFYGETLSREYQAVIDASAQWDAILARYNVQWVIIPPTRPLATVLDLSPGWQRIYSDATAGVWQKLP
ncbi:MAG TPA: hypothetical protein PKZ84_21850 [Anaerolineae bacterium]|nr:hypothetical protein [Anaerolineae bacterium]HQI87049.1 hypothetical protein [Anaerolineae bacterium]